jgi:hypothetical protein
MVALGMAASSMLGWSGQASAQAAPPGAPAPSVTSPPPPPAAPPAATALSATEPRAAAALPATAAPRPTAPGRVATVVFEADHPDAVLESDWSAHGRVPMYMICSTPCEMRVSGDARYRVAGPGLYESTLFALPPDRERVSVKAEMESKSVAGPVLMLVLGGTAFAIVGPILLIAGVEADRRHKDGKGLIISGAVVSLGGAALGLVGLVSLVIKSSHRESKVHIARAARPSLALPGDLSLDASGLRF